MSGTGQTTEDQAHWSKGTQEALAVWAKHPVEVGDSRTNYSAVGGVTRDSFTRQLSRGRTKHPISLNTATKKANEMMRTPTPQFSAGIDLEIPHD